jgi:hypothetical protein
MLGVLSPGKTRIFDQISAKNATTSLSRFLGKKEQIKCSGSAEKGLSFGFVLPKNP